MATGRTKTTFIPILGLAQTVLTGGEYVFPFATALALARPEDCTCAVERPQSKSSVH